MDNKMILEKPNTDHHILVKMMVTLIENTKVKDLVSREVYIELHKIVTSYNNHLIKENEYLYGRIIELMVLIPNNKQITPKEH